MTKHVRIIEYLPYILVGLAVAALVIVGFTYARKHATKPITAKTKHP